MIDHISVGVSTIEAAADFYGPVLGRLGVKELARMDGLVAYGRDRIEFLAMQPFDRRDATAGNGTHVAFHATDEDAVTAFHAAALEAGGQCAGPPGERAYPHATVFAAYVLDPFGNKLEALTAGFAA